MLRPDHMRRHPQPLRIAIDTGGTFTDCVWMEEGRLRMLKVFSTPADPSRAIVEAIRKITSDQDFILLHGTTVGTNTLLERKGARTALITTKGFEDALEIGRQARPKLYDFFFDRIEPLVPKELRFGINERTSADGQILTAPAPEELHSLLANVSAARPQALAISLLFSFANAKNEAAVSDALKTLSIPLSISHQILPEFREYERTSTIVINAYLQPVMQRYLENLELSASTNAEDAAQTRAQEGVERRGDIPPLTAAEERRLEDRRVQARLEERWGEYRLQERRVQDRAQERRGKDRLEERGEARLEERWGKYRLEERRLQDRVQERRGKDRWEDDRWRDNQRVEERPFRAAKARERKGALAPGPRIFVMQSSGGITALATAAREPVRTVLSGPAGGVVGAAATARASGFENIIAFDMGGTSTDVSLVENEIKTAHDAQIAGLPVSVPMLDIHTVGAGGGSLARFDAAGVLRVGPQSAGADPGPICYGRGTQPTVTDANLLLGRLQPERFLGGDFRLDLERTRRLTQEWLKNQGSNLSLEKFAAGVIQVVNATMEKAIRVVSIERGRDPRNFALVAFGGAGGLHACALAEALRIPRVIVPALPGALSALGILASDVVKDYSRTILWRASGKIPQKRLAREFEILEKSARTDFRAESWRGSPRFHRSVDVRYRGQGYELNTPFTPNLLTDFQQEHQRRYGYTHPHREIELVTLRLRGVLKSAAAQVGTAALGRPGRGKHGRLSPAQAPVLFGGKKVRTKIYTREDLGLGRRYSGPAIITEYSATSVVPPGSRFCLDKAANLIVMR